MGVPAPAPAASASRSSPSSDRVRLRRSQDGAVTHRRPVLHEPASQRGQDTERLHPVYPLDAVAGRPACGRGRRRRRRAAPRPERCSRRGRERRGRRARSVLTSWPTCRSRSRARRYRDGDLAGAWLAHAATDDPAVNARGGRRGGPAPGSGACAPTTRAVGGVDAGCHQARRCHRRRDGGRRSGRSQRCGRPFASPGRRLPAGRRPRRRGLLRRAAAKAQPGVGSRGTSAASRWSAADQVILG